MPRERKLYKCFVPICKNFKGNSTKLFFVVPVILERRLKWFEAVHDSKKTLYIPRGSLIYCCEDHFNLEEDVVNWVAYQRGDKRIIIKEDIVPHKFIHSPPPPEYENFTQFPLSMREEKCQFQEFIKKNKIHRREKCFVPICKNFRIRNSKEGQIKVFLSIPHRGIRRIKWYEAVCDPKKPFYLPSSGLCCCEDHFNLEEDAENWIAYKTIDSKLKIKNHIVPHQFINTPPPPGHENVTQFPLSMRQEKWQFQKSLEDSQSEYYKSLKKRTLQDSEVVKFESKENEYKNGILFKVVEVARLMETEESQGKLSDTWENSVEIIQKEVDFNKSKAEVEMVGEDIKVKTEEIVIEEMDLNEADIKIEDVGFGEEYREDSTEMIKKQEVEEFNLIAIKTEIED